MERLKAFSVEKFTLDGRKFHTLTFDNSLCEIPTSSTVNTAITDVVVMRAVSAITELFFSICTSFGN